MNIAIIGATGLIGEMLLKILTERNFPVSKIIPSASEKSVGTNVTFKGKKLSCVSIEDALKEKCDIAFFAVDTAVSKEFVPRFAEKGTFVIDKSFAFRLQDGIPLVVPEINGGLVTKKNKIIANPNCSTIQLVMAIAPLHRKYKIKRMVVSTYQSVSGTGKNAVVQMENERTGIPSTRDGENAYHYTIDKNVIPHCDKFLEDGYTMEEFKLIHETKKILNDYDIKITATAVRVPVFVGHSESVNLTFEKDFDLDEVKNILKSTKGISLMNDDGKNIYPMPLYAEGKDDVFVGRIRRDDSAEKSLNLWVVSDNLRKGAATNGVQIAELLLK